MNTMPARYLQTLIAALAALTSVASVRQSWTVETSRVAPAQFQAYHGETLELSAALTSYGVPIVLTGQTATLYWQTNGMGTAYWSAPASIVSSNVVSATWIGAYDTGAPAVRGFIGIGSNASNVSYRASFTIRLMPSTGATPNELPLPAKTIDYATITVLHADESPFALKGSSGGGGADTNTVKSLINSEVGGTNTLAHIGDNVAWSNVTNAPDFVTKSVTNGILVAAKEYADQYADQAPFYSTVSNMAVNSAQIVGPARSVTVGECIISRQGSENSSYNGSYFYDYNGANIYYLPWNELWSTALPAYRLARIADIPTDYIPAAGDTNSVSAILAAARTDSASIAEAKAADTRAIVATWENFLDGSNVVFSITNYISGTYNLDNAKFRILEMTNGFYREVYNSREEITMHINNFKNNDFRVATNQVITSVNEKIAGKADKAWGRYTSAGGVAPSNTVYMTEPQTVFAGGLEYERVAVGEGSVCVLTTAGAPVYTAGDEGTFKFQDDGGTNYFGFAKTDSYTIGCNTDGITVQNSIVTLTYNVTMSGVPCIWYKQDVGTAGPWEQLNLSDGTAVPGASHLVTWDMSPAAGTEVCYINCANQAKGFFKATVEVPGSAKFMTNMPADLGGGIICTNTATGVNGVIRPSFNGSTVIWSWSAQ